MNNQENKADQKERPEVPNAKRIGYYPEVTRMLQEIVDRNRTQPKGENGEKQVHGEEAEQDLAQQTIKPTGEVTIEITFFRRAPAKK